MSEATCEGAAAPEGLSAPVDTPYGPNCGVTAVAIAAGISFCEAFTLIKKQGRRAGNWQGRTYAGDRRKALDTLKVKHVPVALPSRRMSLKTWVNTLAVPGHHYMVTTTGHIQTVRDGMVVDQVDRMGLPVSAFWGRNKIVKDIVTCTRIPVVSSLPK